MYPKPLVLPLIISENLDDFWALNARATSKKLTVFSMKTGQLLPGAGGEKELKTPTCQQLETKVFSFFCHLFFFLQETMFFQFFPTFFRGIWRCFKNVGHDPRPPLCWARLRDPAAVAFRQSLRLSRAQGVDHPMVLDDGDDISMIFL